MSLATSIDVPQGSTQYGGVAVSKTLPDLTVTVFLTASIAPLGLGLNTTVYPDAVTVPFYAGGVGATVAVTASAMTPIGSYTLTVTGTMGTTTHSAQMTVNVRPQQFQPRALLLYRLGYRGNSYLGGSVAFVSNFTNQGTVAVSVTAVRISTDFGNFNGGDGLPLALGLGETRLVSVTINIPSTAFVGNHAVTAVGQWEYFANSS